MMIAKICSVSVAFAALSVGATEYYWTGAADNYTVTNRLNWVLSDGTVPAETPDLSASLVPVRVRVGKTSYRGKLVKTSAEVDGNQMTVYSADYEATGLMILIR